MGGRVKGPETLALLGPETTSIATRPPPGPARGSVPAPVWLVVALSGALLLVSALLLWRNLRRRQP
jgi:hypothetical protein